MSNKYEIARLSYEDLSDAEKLKFRRQLSPGIKPMPSETDRIVRRREVARMFSVSLRSIDNWAKQGLLERRRLRGRIRGCGYLLSDVESLMGVNHE